MSLKFGWFSQQNAIAASRVFYAQKCDVKKLILQNIVNQHFRHK